MNRRKLLVGAGATTLMAFGAPRIRAQEISQSKPNALPQDGASWFTNASVTTHEGHTVRFYDDLLKGKIVLINCFYTECDAICTSMAQNLTLVQDLLVPRLGHDIFMYSITLQPRHDTPEVLQAYASRFSTKPGRLFLTGTPDELEVIYQRLGLIDTNPAPGASQEHHIGILRIGNEPKHRWIAKPGLLNPGAIVRSVKRTIPEFS